MPLVEFDELLSVAMWLGKNLIGFLVINTLTMLTIAHTDPGKPALKSDERPFRNGLFRDLKINAKINAKMILTNNQPYKLSYTLIKTKIVYLSTIYGNFIVLP